MKKTSLFLLLLPILLLGCFSKKEITKNAQITPIKKEFFKITPETLTNGDSIILVKWSMNADSIFLDGVKLDSSGSKTFVIDTTTIFSLDVIKDGKNTTYTKTVVFVPKTEIKQEIPNVTNLKKNKDHTYSKGVYDGRFTVGTEDGYRLMYGFPIPVSTSHFVFTVDDAYASNGPNLNNIDSSIIYFGGNFNANDAKYSGTNRTEVAFMLDSVFITQIIQPVNNNLKPVPDGELGNFLHIIYKIDNFSGQKRNVGLMVLMDMMIDDNDSAYTYINGKKVNNETSFSGSKLPKNFQSLRTEEKFKELHATTLFTNDDKPFPDTISIGNWGHYYNTVWDISASNKVIGDNAYFLKWNKQIIQSQESLSFSYYFGVENKKVNLMFNNSEAVKDDNLTLYYVKIGQTNLSNSEKSKIKYFYNKYKQKHIYGLIIKGYSDAYGETLINQKLSLKRANKAKRFFIKQGIKSSQIIVKGFGESHAFQGEDALKYGNLKDRKVEIIIYYED